MPVFSHDYLHKVASHIYRAEGASDEEARIVANHQVKANLVGHDSHGVILLPVYVERIRIGHLIPGAPFVVEKESPTTACINGNWGFGFVVTEKAMGMAIEKARANNVAAITVYRQSHIGRLGDYATMAAEEGMIGLITADSGAGPKAVAPFGGRERRLGTNSICIGADQGHKGSPAIWRLPCCWTWPRAARYCPWAPTKDIRARACPSWWRCSRAFLRASALG